MVLNAVRFFAHDASRTGAPLALLTFLRWLRNEANFDADLVLWRGGDLVDDFAEVVPTTVIHRDLRRRSLAEDLELGLSELGLPRFSRVVRDLRVRRHRGGSVDLLYLNGVGASLPWAALGDPSVPVLVHAHELDLGAVRALAPEVGSGFWACPQRWVSVAPRVTRFLQERGVTPDEIDLVPGYLPVHPEGRSVDPPDPSVPLVVSVGAGSWRKGIDLFLTLVASLHSRRPDVRFAWIGRLDDPDLIQADVEAAGIGQVVDFPGEVANPASWVSAATTMVSTAREDAFPLAGLEALAAGVRVVTFDNGGLADLVGSADTRDVIPPLDVVALVHRVEEALDEPSAPSELTDQVRSRHTIEVAGPRLLAAMERAVA